MVRNGCTLSGRGETPQELVFLWFLVAPKLAQVGRMGIPVPNLLSKATVQQTLVHCFILWALKQRAGHFPVANWKSRGQPSVLSSHKAAQRRGVAWRLSFILET